MNKMLVTAAALAVVLPMSALAADDHVVARPESLEWSAGPPSLPRGAQIAIVSGDPSKEGLYVLRLKLTAGSKLPPHMHRRRERDRDLGHVQHRNGRQVRRQQGPQLKAGSFAKAPKGMAHYAWFRRIPSSKSTGSDRPASPTSIRPTTRVRSRRIRKRASAAGPAAQALALLIVFFSSRPLFGGGLYTMPSSFIPSGSVK